MIIPGSLFSSLRKSSGKSQAGVQLEELAWAMMQIDVDTCRLSEVMTRRYRLISLLGQGGMGRVFLCDGPEGRVAVKVTRLLGMEGEQSQAFKQSRHEASILRGLSHPNLVGIRDYIEEENHSYLVMDYLPGETLAQRVTREGPVPVATALVWARQLCEALDFLHRQNPTILFRDLKPSNVMVDGQERLKLIDFGIARVQVTGVLTATFLQGVGSAGYAPLEQYQGAGSTDQRSDIYALGATLFYALTGRTPASPIDVVAEASQVPSVRFFNPAIPAWLDSVIRKMMATRKENRFQTASEAGFALNRMIAIDDEPTEPLSAPARSGDRAVYAATGFLTTAALGLMGWLFLTAQTPAETATSPVPTAVVASSPQPLTASVSPTPPARVPDVQVPVAVRPVPVKARIRPTVPKLPGPALAFGTPELPTSNYPTAPVRVPQKKAEPVVEPTPVVSPSPIYQVVEVQSNLPEVPASTPSPSPSPSQTPPVYPIASPFPEGYPSNSRDSQGGNRGGWGQGPAGPAGPMMGGHGGFGGHR